jgi:hypothetical protein
MPEAYVFTRYGGPETEAFAAVRAAGVKTVNRKRCPGFRRPAEGAERVFPVVFGNEAAR